MYRPAGGWAARGDASFALGFRATAVLEFYARGARAWTGLRLDDAPPWFEEEVAAILDINYAKVMQAALIPVAYSLRENFKPAYREPIQKITHWDSW